VEFFENYLLKSFQKVLPDIKGRITPEESIRQVLDVIENLTTEQTGFMISHHGNEEWF
jgi:hypothetical protein